MRYLGINEVNLLSFIDCDQVVKFHEAIDFSNQVWIVMEHMEEGDLSGIIMNRKGDFSEDFCKWSLY